MRNRDRKDRWGGTETGKTGGGGTETRKTGGGGTETGKPGGGGKETGKRDEGASFSSDNYSSNDQLILSFFYCVMYQ